MIVDWETWDPYGLYVGRSITMTDKVVTNVVMVDVARKVQSTGFCEKMHFSVTTRLT